MFLGGTVRDVASGVDEFHVAVGTLVIPQLQNVFPLLKREFCFDAQHLETVTAAPGTAGRCVEDVRLLGTVLPRGASAPPLLPLDVQHV